MKKGMEKERLRKGAVGTRDEEGSKEGKEEKREN